MPAPRKYDAETQERAVRMYRDRIAEHGGSKIAARRHVGELLGIAPATLRNWIETAERKDSPPTVSTSDNDADLDEVRRLRKENAELRRANEIVKTASAFFRGGGGRPPTAVIVDYIDAHRERFGGVDPI